MEVYHEDLILEGQNEEILQLKMRLESVSDLNREYLKQIQQKDEIIKEQRRDNEIQVSRLRSEIMEKEDENNGLKKQIQEISAQNIFTDNICGLLECTNISEAPQKIEELKNINIGLHVSVSAAQVSGKANFKNSENEERFEELRNNFSTELTSISENYEQQLTYLRTVLKQKNREITNLNETIQHLEGKQSKFEEEMAEVERVKDEALQRYETVNVDMFRLSQENDSLRSELENKQLEIEGITTQGKDLEEKEAVYQETFNKVLQSINQFHAQNPHTGVTVCESLYNIFLQLTTDSKTMPSMQPLYDSLSTTPKQGVDEGFIKNICQTFSDYSTHMQDLFNDALTESNKRIASLDSKLDSSNGKLNTLSDSINNLIQDINDWRDEAKYLEDNDMAPLAASLQKQVDDLKRRLL